MSLVGCIVERCPTWQFRVQTDRRKIRLIESNAKCRYLKIWPVNGLCGSCFICLRPPPHTLIESNAKSRYLKIWPVHGLCGSCLICLRPPPHTLIESNAKCHYLKILLVHGLCGRCFICLRPPPHLWPHIPPHTLYTYSHMEKGGGGGGELTREKVSGAIVHIAGDWLTCLIWVISCL